MPPNVLIVVPTPLSADHMSCYGYDRPTTPNLDALARLGARFESAYASCNWTAPGYASILTGLYPTAHGVFGHQVGLDETVETMAQLLGRHGYETIGMVNHVHAGRLKGVDRGFDEFLEFRRVWEDFGVLRRGDIIGPNSRGLSKTARTVARAVANYAGFVDKGTRDTTRRAIRWMQAHRRAGQPFLMVLEYHQLHAPFGAPGRDRYRFLRADGLGRKDVQALGLRLRRHAGRHAATAQQARVLDGLYDGEIAYLDRWLGRLFDHVLEEGRDDTAIVVVAPHGLSTRGHGYLYEPTMHVPLIVVCPDRVDAGQVVSGLAQTTDVLPTVLDLAGADGPPYRLQGDSLLPITEMGTRRRFVAAELFTNTDGGRQRGATLPPPQHEQPPDLESYVMRMYRSGWHKYIATSYGAEELYDLETDPTERTNVAASRPQLAAALRADLARWVSSFEAREGVREPDDIESSLIDELRNTGYRL